MQAILPYQKTAQFYDHLLSHVDYKFWANYIDEISASHNLAEKSMLDLACGTGSFLKQISCLGYSAAGIELSLEMVEQARFKNPGLEINVADMLRFKSDQSYPLITCLFDSVNYLDNLEAITELCNATFSNLKTKGLFIFDSVSERHCLTHYFDYSEYDRLGDIDYERRCQFDMVNKIQRSTFIIHDKDDEYIEVHNQFIYKHDAIISAIASSKLNFEAAYSDFTFDRVSKKSERIHYVCRKV
ncbi:MAG: methyltransferase domain-containing protein [Calditrichaeota bacterium]|nr:methyltransferase domain-containing protein [Calditrichota bacterium]